MNRKWFVISLSICIFISIIFAAMFKIDNENIKIDQSSNYSMNTESCKYYIDNLNNDGKYITISGWFLETNKDLKYINREVVLQDANGKLYKINTNMVARQDVTKAIGNDTNYDKSGFNARGKVSKLEKNTEYKIGILYSNEDGIKKLFSTDKIIKL